MDGSATESVQSTGALMSVNRMTGPLARGAVVSLCVVSASLTVSCGKPYYTNVMRTGALFPSRGAGCAVEFLEVPVATAMSDRQSIGMITLSGASSAELTAEMKEDIRGGACKMGADAVVLNAAIDNTANYGGGAAFSYVVLKKK
jgi:hypothetical protein